MAAKSELEDRSSSESARHLFLRALRFHPNNKKVYQEVKEAKYFLKPKHRQSLPYLKNETHWETLICLNEIHWKECVRCSLVREARRVFVWYSLLNFSNDSVLVLPYGTASLWETEEAEARTGESWDGPGECVTNRTQAVAKCKKSTHTHTRRERSSHFLFSAWIPNTLFTPFRVNMSFLQRSWVVNWLRLYTEMLQGKSKVGCFFCFLNFLILFKNIKYLKIKNCQKGLHF